jgi:hypothetical protein
MTGHIRSRGENSWELKFDLGRDPATGKRPLSLLQRHQARGTAQARRVNCCREQRLLHRTEQDDGCRFRARPRRPMGGGRQHFR